MSSHHLNHDPNYLLRLQNMRISEGSNNKSPHRIENNVKEQQQHHQQQPQQMVNPKNSNYDRNTILTSSKFVPKQHQPQPQQQQQQQHHQQHSSSQGGYYLNNSPTHSSLSGGSSQHSESPRTSLIGPGQLVYDTRSGHLYENLDYYTQQQQQQHSPTEQIGYFESSNKKAQPQVPIGGGSGSIHGLGGQSINSTNGQRYAHTPQPEYEPPPIYENLQQVTGQRAQPQASPANATMYYERNGTNSPHQQHQQQQPQLPPPYPTSTALNQSRNSPIRGQHSHTSSNASIKSQYSNNGQSSIGNYPKQQMPKQLQQHLPPQQQQQLSQQHQQLAQQQNYVQYATMKPISNSSSSGGGSVFYSTAPPQSAVPAYEYKAPERHHSSAVSTFFFFFNFIGPGLDIFMTFEDKN